MSGQPDFHPSGPAISVQKGLPWPRQCSAAASMASSASVASCPCPPQKCLLFSSITTQPFAESHDRSLRPPAKAFQSPAKRAGKRIAQKYELLLRFLGPDRTRAESLGLTFHPVDAHRDPADLRAVQHHVVGL